MTKGNIKPFPKDLEKWLVSAARYDKSLASVASKAMIEKFGTKENKKAITADFESARQKKIKAL